MFSKKLALSLFTFPVAGRLFSSQYVRWDSATIRVDAAVRNSQNENDVSSS